MVRRLRSRFRRYAMLAFAGLALATVLAVQINGWRDEARYHENYERSYSVQSVNDIPLLNRNIQVSSVESPNTLKLTDGRILRLAHVLPPDESDQHYALAKAQIDAIVRHSEFLAHGPLVAIDGALNTFDADVFYFSQGGVYCGNTPKSERVPTWTYLNARLVQLGLASALPDAPEMFQQYELSAMEYGVGLWSRPEMLRERADLGRIESRLRKDSDGYESFKLARILVRAGDPHASDAIRTAFHRTGQQGMSLLAPLLELGDRKTLDDLVTSFVAPSDAYPEDGRYWRLERLGQYLHATFGSYRSAYRWYSNHRDELVVDDRNDGIRWGDRRFFNVPVEPDDLGCPFSRIGSKDVFPVQELWIAQAWARKWVMNHGAIYGMTDAGLIRCVNPDTGAVTDKYAGPKDSEVWHAGNCDFDFHGRTMIYASDEGKVVGVSRDTWKEVWEAPLLLREDQCIGSTPSHVLIPLQSGELAALEPSTGRTVWRAQLNAAAERGRPRMADVPCITPVFVEGRILARAGNHLALLDEDSGKISGYFDYTFARVSSPPAVWEDVVYTTDDSRKLVALSINDRSLLWSRELGGGCAWPINTTLQVAEEGIYVAERDAIALFSHNNGDVIRRKSFGLGDFRIMFSLTDRYVMCLVSREKQEAAHPGAVFIALNRRDWTESGRWPIGNAGREVYVPFPTQGDRAYLGMKPLRCLRVFETAAHNGRRTATP